MWFKVVLRINFGTDWNLKVLYNIFSSIPLLTNWSPLNLMKQQQGELVMPITGIKAHTKHRSPAWLLLVEI